MYVTNKAHPSLICIVFVSNAPNSSSSIKEGHTYTHTHTHTHLEQWAANVAARGEQLGVQCLAQGNLSHGIEGGETTGHLLPPPTIPAGPETRTHNLRVTSPTLSIYRYI